MKQMPFLPRHLLNDLQTPVIRENDGSLGFAIDFIRVLILILN